MAKARSKRKAAAKPREDGGPELARGVAADVASAAQPASTGGLTLQRSAVEETPDQAFWAAIKNRTEAIGFTRYREFVTRALCTDPYEDTRKVLKGGTVVRTGEDLEIHDKCVESADPEVRLGHVRSQLHGVNAHQWLKVATECFLMLECGVAIKRSKDPDTGDRTSGEFVGAESGRFSKQVTAEELQDRLEEYLGGSLGTRSLPYLRTIARNLSLAIQGEEAEPEEYSPFCDGAPRSRLASPCLLELIWSYWHEEGMLVQAINAISLRFQNKRGPGAKDPLAPLEIDPLRPMANLLWGYIQDEPHRLTISRRAYEYSHHYGLPLLGKAAPNIRPADVRSKFLEAFHSLLQRTWAFYQEDADTTVISEGFPLLNALKEVHMLLAEGAHNQFGDLPWTARVEMLMQQWLLSRKEIQEFLRGRAMVPHREAWMGQVDTMKRLQGWTDASVTHFRDLGVFGEQILLSIRYGHWTAVENPDSAKNWARYWKSEIQTYIHAYRAVTGVDLTNPDRLDSTPPAIHLRRRLARQARPR